jgi:uncharacterized Zn finger protein
MTIATIPSRTSSRTYTVTLHDDGAASCTCPAGQHGRCCWHVKALRAETERRDALARERARLASIRSRADCHPESASYYAPLLREARERIAALER